MTDLLDRLEAARPTQAALDSRLPADVLERIKADVARETTPRARPPHRRRRVLAAVAATIAGVVIVPVLAGSDGSAARADLTELAMVAANSDGPAITPGTFLHVKTEALQRNSRLFGDGRTLDTHREQWVRWDGVVWVIDTRPSAGWTDYMVLPKNDGHSPELAAELPDSASDLRAHLDRTVSGSNSHEEAIFVAITDWVYSNLLPPKTLAAALEVLADVDGVETKDVTVRGREAIEVSFNRYWFDLISTESMVIDRETARTISEYDSDLGGTYELETTLVEVVEEIPADVLRDFAAHKDDGRVYNDGHAPPADER
ncbi:hypothetical protein [Nocardioides jishulii]|uniref:CU044_5270 family protein n=1 Tax=Nocardioides jishulii TaxID=2575440 RepID=A0A4U2YL33_9ACTN|nr:hypothetical protein [Nocardioides jishulii]QCX26801.1 hypothetical protein FCL41_04030 [Nocardioides jishulii]TKI61285.1 hypothetical protein FC770_10665 [Nocardioides jishulii]